MTQVTCIQGDITEQDVEAVVNAANETLLGGGGVDGAIHRAAGPQLLAECRTLGGCLTGQAKLTKGHNLPAAYVIHTVAPVYGHHNGHEAELLANCYRSCLDVAQEHGIRSVAFPALGVGTYGNPKKPSTRIALETVRDWIDAHPKVLDEVRFVLFNSSTLALYQSTWAT